ICGRVLSQCDGYCAEQHCRESCFQTELHSVLLRNGIGIGLGVCNIETPVAKCIFMIGCCEACRRGPVPRFRSSYALSLSNSVRVPSSTSHFFKMEKMVFVPTPPRANCRNTRAASF